MLPPPFHLYPFALSLLDDRLHTQCALVEAPTFIVELQTQCSELDRSLDELTWQLRVGLTAQVSFFNKIHSLFGNIIEKLFALSSIVLVIRIVKVLPMSPWIESQMFEMVIIVDQLRWMDDLPLTHCSSGGLDRQVFVCLFVTIVAVTRSLIMATWITSSTLEEQCSSKQ